MKVFSEALQKVGVFVLQEWGMMMVDPVENPPPPFHPQETFYVVTAKYTGVFDGALTCICQDEFLERLAQNVLGYLQLDAITEEDKLDSLREFANIVSGNFLVEAFGPETVFELPRIEASYGDYESVKRFFTNQAIYCLGDGAPVALHFEIHAE